VTPRGRILAFGSAGTLVVAGAICAALVGGLTGEVLTIVLISAGVGGALLLVFLEIGLGEERELEHERKRRERQQRRIQSLRRPWLGRRPRRPG
jgi:hypothetical protein